MSISASLGQLFARSESQFNAFPPSSFNRSFTPSESTFVSASLMTRGSTSLTKKRAQTKEEFVSSLGLVDWHSQHRRGEIDPTMTCRQLAIMKMTTSENWTVIIAKPRLDSRGSQGERRHVGRDGDFCTGCE